MKNKISKLTVRCPRGEIGRHKGLKSLGIGNIHSLIQSHSVLNYY